MLEICLGVRAYGITRDELRYILDPADVKGATYPSETFRVLKPTKSAVSANTERPASRSLPTISSQAKPL